MRAISGMASGATIAIASFQPRPQSSLSRVQWKGGGVSKVALTKGKRRSNGLAKAKHIWKLSFAGGYLDGQTLPYPFAGDTYACGKCGSPELYIKTECDEDKRTAVFTLEPG
jgi:hypothetical protein